MSQQFNIAILGATGAVGETLIEVLQERDFPVGELYLLASERSEGKTYRFNGKTVAVQNVEEFDWSQAHIALFSAGGSLSEKWAPIAADEGVVVIDNTSHFRYEYDVPLVVPEVNPEAVAEFRNRNIIANPNCSTIQMLVALKPIHDAVGIDRINVSTYQSVAGAGKAGIDELAGQTAKLLNGKPAEPEAFSQQIAFNCIPQIDKFMDNGYTKEEMKMVWETQKIFNDSSIMVNPTCVRVPVFYGHAEAVHIETRAPIDAEEVTQLLESAEGIEVFHGEDFPTQVRDAGGKDHVLVGRIRNDISHHSGVNLWVVADNVRKGAATNAVQIAEVLIRDYF
ncbi:aspartate-semialdehyde dehydrogenase [Vibrio marisflavi]|uniref:Aspartate-semialdehyde dehydrogenase n=1 Tax=Vibrio marisflavi CECT 7928 TaxID=634439 RepID=A0ABM9A6T6_9VIBR|nr:aspartate-semialdehyde dehydrogenase [Vibrio marisflavi]CAH0540811.1 Aspartate-semialdehyde dehydrogenase 2 [Vibrio marisflavi CECT 7928]